ncbi:MAG: hypothetical protein GC161_08990 [Planctomycetaceae bacterium]|nr:hypothetical protein [Planctomycetaceae bacterium]
MENNAVTASPDPVSAGVVERAVPEPGPGPGVVAPPPVDPLRAVGPIDLRLCDSAADRAAIFGFRQTAWRGRSDYLFGNRRGRHPAEDEHDDDAFHFAAWLGSDVVAACRWCPSGPRGFEAEQLASLPPGALPARDTSLQISRLVVREDLRRTGVSEALLREGCRALLELTRYRGWFALAVPRLAAHYVSYGGVEVAGFEVELAARAGQRYRLVKGGMESSDVAITRSLEARPPGTIHQFTGRERPRVGAKL